MTAETLPDLVMRRVTLSIPPSSSDIPTSFRSMFDEDE
jgi:hypothetical protein